MIYLAGPIDAVSQAQSQMWRAHASVIAQRAGSSCFLPTRAFVVAPGDVGAIQPINDGAIDACRVVVVNLTDEDARMVGTLMELGRALALRMPVVAWVKKGGTLRHHVSLHHPGIQHFEDLEEAMEIAVELDQQRYPDAFRETASMPQVSVYRDLTAIEFAPGFRDEDEPLPFDQKMIEAGAQAPLIEQDWHQRRRAWVDETFPLPSRAHPGDAGFDLQTGRDMVINPGQLVDVPLAHRVFPPKGYWFRLLGRSSTWRKWGLQVSEGVIDEGYTGPLFAAVYNPTKRAISVPRGTRLVQAIIQEVLMDGMGIQFTDKIPATSRGGNGFGSSGK